jgi:hypothetical protein
LLFGQDILSQSLRRFHPVAGKPVIRNSNQAADAVHTIQRTRIQVRDKQCTSGLQDTAHLRQCLSRFGEMDHQANERRIKGLGRKRRLLAVFHLERHVGSFDPLLRQREHAGGNVSGNYGVRLTYQYLSVKAGAAAKLRQLA